MPTFSVVTVVGVVGVVGEVPVVAVVGVVTVVGVVAAGLQITDNRLPVMMTGQIFFSPDKPRFWPVK